MLFSPLPQPAGLHRSHFPPTERSLSRTGFSSAYPGSGQGMLALQHRSCSSPPPPVETGAEPPAPAPLPAPDRDSLFCREVNHRLCPQTPGPCTSRLQRLPWLQHLPPQPTCAAAEPPAGSRQTPGTPARSQDTNSSHQASSGQHSRKIPIPFGYLPGGTRAICAAPGTPSHSSQPWPLPLQPDPCWLHEEQMAAGAAQTAPAPSPTSPPEASLHP